MNEVIFDDSLTNAEFRTWCRLLALPKGSSQVTIEVDDIAEQFGTSATNFRTQRRALKEKGYLVQERGRLVVTIPDKNLKPKETKLTKKQQLREDLKNAWNSSKPDAYSRMRSPLSLNQVDTLVAHADHNEALDLCKFLTSVLNGCKAEDWWKSKNLNFSNVFGTGIPKQNKFTNVEKLYKLANSKQGRAALFNPKDDQCWLEWFHAKGHTDMAKVVRLEMERSDAWQHDMANEGDGIIYIYTQGESLVHWTNKERSCGVSYLPTAK